MMLPYSKMIYKINKVSKRKINIEGLKNSQKHMILIKALIMMLLYSKIWIEILRKVTKK